MRLQWLPRALADRAVLLGYVARENPAAAVVQGDHISMQMELLLDHPKMGRDGRVPGTRELVISHTPYITVYRIRPRAGRIEVLRVLHGAQQWPPSG